MANVFAVHSVGSSIMTFLRNTYPTNLAGQPMPACGFELMSSGQLAGEIDETTRLTLYLYRLTVNEHSRLARPPSVSLATRRCSLAVSALAQSAGSPASLPRQPESSTI